MKKLLLSLLIVVPCYADQVAVTKFKGINADQNAIVIDPSEAQDLLNVDVSHSGNSIKKRPGYGLYKTLSTSQALHGGFHFFDSSGNDVQVWGSSTSIYGIVADAAPAQIVSSMTLNSTIDCADTQGSAYCVSSNRDFYIKTNGATLTNWATSPLGTMIEAMPDRIAVAGVSGNLSTIYHSGSNAFTTYTTGPLSTDPFTEVIAAPGSKITHLRYACGKLLWWKDQSFGYEAFDDQYSLQIKIISDNIGTLDNTSAVDPGGAVWFRGQDGHIWQYNCSGLIKQSIEITPLVQASSKRTSNSWTITSQSDFQTGSSSPTYPNQPLSYTISSGEVVPGSYTVTENSSTQWNSGTASNVTVSASSLVLATNNSGTVSNSTFDSGLTGWSSSGIEGWIAASTFPTMTSCGGTTLNPQSGSFFASISELTGAITSASIDAIDLNSNVLASATIPINNNCTWVQTSLSPGSYQGKRVKFRFHGVVSGGDNVLTTSDSYIWGGAISFYYTSATKGTQNVLGIDSISSGSSTITSGSFTSQAFNTGLPYGYVYPTASWTNVLSTPSFTLQQSADGSAGWTTLAVSTAVNDQASQKFLRYVLNFSLTGQTDALSSVTSITLLERSSGTYYSPIKNAPSLAAYSTFNPTYSNGGGSHAFYVRASNLPFNVITSTGPLWTAQPANALIASTFTATYLQFIDSFTITSATDTAPVLSDYVANWFEGTATDQAYLAYFDNAIWTDVAYGTGVSSNTYIFKYDLINEGWTLYNFGAGGMLTQNGHFYFGDVGSTGKIFQYDSGHSDNGSAINAFWKTKEFTGQDPFLQTSLLNIDTFAKKDAGSTLTATYTLDTSTTTNTYSISLSSPSASVVQSRKMIPAGKTGYSFDLKLGDSSDSSNWEIFGVRIGFNQNPYRPSL